MELGGKTPALVLDNADLENAARNIAFGAFCHRGQICFATSRIIVVRKVAGQFVTLLKEELASKYADGLGSAATRAFALSEQAMVEAARKDGAEFSAGNSELIGPNRTTLAPIVVTGVKHDTILADEEAFGLAASLYIVEDWPTRPIALDLSGRLDYGIVHINACSLADLPITPVQGHKASGWGSNNADYGIDEFLELKTVTIRPAPPRIQFEG
ncbi:hypothetical protein OQA88_10457 [Cercophora sp. LCS_1]